MRRLSLRSLHRSLPCSMHPTVDPGSSSQYRPSRDGWTCTDSSYPSHSTFFVSTPLIVIACLLPFIISASNAFNVAVDIFTQLDTGLTAASAAAAQGVLLNPAHLLDLANQANAAIPLAITTFQRVWLGWSIAACFLFPVSSPSIRSSSSIDNERRSRYFYTRL